MEQESHVFNQIKFSKLAVKTGLLWFIPVYQVHEQERQREQRQAAVASIRKEPLISTAPSVTKSNSHSPLIWFSSIILILLQPLWTQTTKKKALVLGEWEIEYYRVKVLRLQWFKRSMLFSIKMYSWERDLFSANAEIWNCSYLGGKKCWYKSRLGTWKQRLS